MIAIAGGEDVFPQLAKKKAAKDRIVTPEAVIAANPDVILASWCGKKVVPDKIHQRAGWETIAAVRASVRDCPDLQRLPIRMWLGDRPPALKS